MKKLLWLLIIAAFASGWMYINADTNTSDHGTIPMLCGPDEPAPPPPPPPK